MAPRQVTLEPYAAEAVFEILRERAQQALAPRSLHREALTYIASSTQNVALALAWLRHAAHVADDVVTEDLVAGVESAAYGEYVDALLADFSPHHQLLYRAIVELVGEDGEPVQSGAVYGRYSDLCDANSEEQLSNRRISDFLKHLEFLDVVTVEYHYGGSKGKTREISMVKKY